MDVCAIILAYMPSPNASSTRGCRTVKDDTHSRDHVAVTSTAKVMPALMRRLEQYKSGDLGFSEIRRANARTYEHEVALSQHCREAMRGNPSKGILSLDLQLSSAPMIERSTQVISLLPYTATHLSYARLTHRYGIRFCPAGQAAKECSWSVCQMNEMVVKTRMHCCRCLSSQHQKEYPLPSVDAAR